MTKEIYESSPLERYGNNLTILAQKGVFSPLSGHQAVLNRMFQVLLRGRKCNPLLLDIDQTRRWTVVIEMVRRMAVGDAPTSLSKKQVLALNYEALFSDSSGDPLLHQERRKQTFVPLLKILAPLEQETDEAWLARVRNVPLWPELHEWVAPTVVLERLQAMFIAMQQAPDSFLLFIDPFHRLLGGENDRYWVDAFELLKPALARQQIQLIAGCTLPQYQQYIERNSSIKIRFQEVVLANAS